MIEFKHFLTEKVTGCPIATVDIHVNLKNRQHAIDEYYYGPANPEKPGDYWKDAAKRWKIDDQTAKSMTCSNCAAFDTTPKMLDCIEKGIAGSETKADARSVIEHADLGYCTLFHFKCAGARSCTAWLTKHKK